MDLDRANIYLNKITRLYTNLKDSRTSVSAIEKKLMLDYISNLYDAVLEETPSPKQVYTAAAPRVAPTPPPPRQEIAPTPPPRVEAPQPRYEPEPPAPKKVFNEPIVVERQTPVAPTPQPQPEKRKVYVFETPKATPKATPKPAPKSNEEYDELFEVSVSNDISDKLSSKPIADIKRAMGINERFLTINELFGGNSSKFEATVNAINALTSYEAARAYLENNAAQEFEWMDNKRLNKAKRFVKLVYRRFQK